MSARSFLSKPWYVSGSAAVLIGALSWLGTYLGTFGPIDHLVYDGLVGLRARFRHDRPRVLLVDTGRADRALDERTVEDVVSELTRLGSSSIVLDVELASASEEALSALLRSGKVVLARPVARDSGREGMWALGMPRVDRLYDRLAWGAAVPASLSRGVARSQALSIRAGDEEVPAVEVVAARVAMAAAPGGREVLVDFRGGPGSMPRLSLDRVLANDLIPEVVSGMCVLVGPAGIEGAGLSTPTTAAGEAMSSLEYRGHVLDTICAGRGIRRVSDWVLLGILLAYALLSGLAYRFLGVRVNVRAGISSIAVFVAVAAFLLVRSAIWLPVSSACAIQAVLLVFSLKRSSENLAQTMEQFTSDASSQLRDKYWPLISYSKDTPWPLLARLIHQTLDTTRMVFLEAVPGERRLRFAHGINSDENGRVERRLDYRRAPYADALKERSTLRVDAFFHGCGPGESQYLTPLMVGDELLGFWAFAIEVKKENALQGFDGLIREYGRRMSDLLYYSRKSREKLELSSESGDPRGGETAEALSRELRAAIGLLGDRLGTLEDILDRLEFGVIVFDVFGRVLQINRPMLEVLKREGLRPFDMTALDLILQLGEHDLTAARRHLRRVIVEDASVSFTVALRTSPGKRHRVNIKPLGRNDEGRSRTAREGTAKGVLWEFLDTTSIALAYDSKHKIVERLNAQLRNDLAAIGLGASLLGSRTLLQEQRARIGELVESKVGQGAQLVSDCEQYLAARREDDDLESAPVDPREALRAAQDGVLDALNDRHLRIEPTEPFHVSLVFASRSRLEMLFRQMLLILAGDASEGTAVSVSVQEGPEWVTFDLANTGFGIPDDVFQEYLHGAGGAIGEGFKELRDAVAVVETWGGKLEGRSEVGDGIEFTVRLPKFV